MSSSEHDSPSSLHHWQHQLQTVERLTRLEMSTEDHGERIDEHEQRHDTQDAWNKGFTVALAGLGAGLAHAKANDLLDLIILVLQRLKS